MAPALEMVCGPCNERIGEPGERWPVRQSEGPRVIEFVFSPRVLARKPVGSSTVTTITGHFVLQTKFPGRSTGL